MILKTKLQLIIRTPVNVEVSLTFSNPPKATYFKAYKKFQYSQSSYILFQLIPVPEGNTMPYSSQKQKSFLMYVFKYFCLLFYSEAVKKNGNPPAAVFEGTCQFCVFNTFFCLYQQKDTVRTSNAYFLIISAKMGKWQSIHMASTVCHNLWNRNKQFVFKRDLNHGVLIAGEKCFWQELDMESGMANNQWTERCYFSAWLDQSFARLIFHHIKIVSGKMYQSLHWR